MMYKINFFRALLFLGVSLTLSLIPGDVKASGTFDINGLYHQHSSDYWLMTHWDNLPCGNFGCSGGCDNLIDMAAHPAGSPDYIFVLGHVINYTVFPNIGSEVHDSFYTAVGPSKHYTDIIMRFGRWGCQGGSLHNEDDTIHGTRGTDDIHKPGSVFAVSTTLFNGNVASLTWSKGSDIPDDSLGGYKIFRNYVLIDSVGPGTFSYTDSTLLSNAVYTYSVTTFTTKWGGHESDTRDASVYITNNLLTATDSSLYGKTQLSWPSISFFAPNDIEVLRDSVQIDIISKNSTHYNDFDGIPGHVYSYSIAPVYPNITSPYRFSDNGSSRPNGVLSGYVRSVLGSPIPRVILTATGTVLGQAHTYVDSTNAQGFYKIKDIYYDAQATYTVVPSKGTDMFDPMSLTSVMDQNGYNNSLADIHDTTVFTVSGTATFPAPGSCPVQGAAVYVNGTNTNTTTNGIGQFSFTAQEPGDYTVELKYYNHTFSPAIMTVHVTGNTSGVHFTDIQRDTLLIDLKDGCHNQLVDSARFEITSDTTGAFGCFDSTYTFHGTDPLIITLPAQKYRVKNVDASVNGILSSNIHNAIIPVDLDLARRDTVMIDTIRSSSYHSAVFIYHQPLSIDLTNLDPAPGCSSGIVVEQNVRIPVGIDVKEQSLFYNRLPSSCYPDSGTLTIQDDVSGYGPSTITLAPHRLVYQLIPGEPLVPDAPTSAHRYQKHLGFFAVAGNQSLPRDEWMVITGNKTLTAGFVSRTPPIPLMVLHDPPGSGSYTSYEKDSSFSLDFTNLADTTRNNGGYGHLQIGAVWDAVARPIPGPYINMNISGADGNHTTDNSTTSVNFTATQTISTSSDPEFVGRDADVYIGGTVNTKYAEAYIVTVENCQVAVRNATVYGLDSVTSQFVYTGRHIRETLIPQLRTLLTLAPDSQKAYLQLQITMWDSILYKDSITIATMDRKSNITYSAGIGYDYTTELDSAFSNDYAYSNTRDFDFSIGAGISDATLFDISAGYNLDLHYESGYDRNTNRQLSKSFTYHLQDDIPGNVYSVDIGSDKHFGSPIFRLFAGTSACPHEEGTQFRDVPTLTIAPSTVYNVPATQPASFTATLGNYSESHETRTYNVQLDPSTNLDGAVVKIGGQNITQSPASFTIPSNTSVNATLTVEKGPFADYYDHLAIVISSPCDDNISQTQEVNVHFQSTCSDVALSLPVDHWLANAASHNTMQVAFSGYDAGNANLQEIGLQYRITGSTQPWLSANIIPKAMLTGPVTDFNFDLTPLIDGNYELRAYARCVTQASVQSFTYSPVLTGTIDRTGFDLFGTPQPANGILNRGDDIRVDFNGSIDCSQLYGRINTRLRRNDNNAIIPDTFICTGNGLILVPNPISLLDSLNGVIVTASVTNIFDANGNGLNRPIEWSFLMNRAKVYWNPSNINITNTVGTSAFGIGTLINKDQATQAFTLTTPSWLVPSLLSDSIAPGGLDSIRFTVVPGLNPGTYIDTVIATVGGLRAKLFVKLDVVKPAPVWTVNPADYQYSMNITTNYSLTSLNAPLSTDKRDIIGVFKGDTCRGVAHISFDPFTSKYVAFITAYSNSTVGETFTFRIWDAVPGTEYQATETLNFVNNGIIGQPVAPYILHQGGVFQTVPLTTGWNWFSLNVVAADMSPNNVLAHLHPTDGVVVKGLNSMSQYNASTKSWSGTLASFGVDKSYMIQLNRPDTIHLLGQPVTVATQITIDTGWNWIGYPHQNIYSPTEYLSSANPSDNDLLKTQSQFTQYNGGGWSGSLNKMNPGQGYRLKSKNAINFSVAPDRSLPYWSPQENQFQENQSVTAELQFDGAPVIQSHYLVGAFANGICVATAQPLFIPALNVYRVFLTIHGDSSNMAQAITFKVYDVDNDLEYIPTYDAIAVSPDTTVARIASPYIINVQTATGLNTIKFTDGYALQQNVPNPFGANTSIDYSIPVTQHVTISLYDESGRLVSELVNQNQQAGKYHVSFAPENLQPGVYLYQMRSGDFVKTRRMLIIK